jgi:hypothetical protein
MRLWVEYPSYWVPHTSLSRLRRHGNACCLSLAVQALVSVFLAQNITTGGDNHVGVDFCIAYDYTSSDRYLLRSSYSYHGTVSRSIPFTHQVPHKQAYSRAELPPRSAMPTPFSKALVQEYRGSACSQLVSANGTDAVHYAYFLKQQEAERAFLRAAESTLCVAPVSQALYQRRLDELFEPMRTATHLHINGAFLVKRTCSGNTNIDRDRAQQTAAAQSALEKKHDQETDWCPPAILHHEPHNVAESWHVWNVSAHLLRTGAAFCAQTAAARTELFSGWRARLEVVMAYHRENNAFSVYGDRYVAACAASKFAATDGLLRWDLDRFVARVTNEVEHNRRGCSVAGVTAGELISGFGNDTALTVAIGRQMLGPSSRPEESFCDALPAASRAAAAAALSSSTLAVEGALARLERSSFALSPPAGSAHWVAWALTLATVYHQLVPICSRSDALLHPAGPQSTDWACTAQPSPSDPDGQIVYEMLPRCTAAPSGGAAAGETAAADADAALAECRRAVDALDAYRTFLHRLSPVRGTLIRHLLSGSCPFAAGEGAAAGEGEGAFARRLASLAADLGAVVDGLRRSEHALLPSCVVPSRSSAASRAAQRAAELQGQPLQLPTGHGIRSSADPVTVERRGGLGS